MAEDPKELLFSFTADLGAFGAGNDVQGAQAGVIMDLLGKTIYEGSILDVKTKELVAIGVAVYSRCPYCIALHSFGALEAGASKEEILQASMVASALGGGPAIAYSVTLLKDCIETFQGDSFTEDDRMEILRRLGMA